MEKLKAKVKVLVEKIKAKYAELKAKLYVALTFGVWK